MCVNVAIKRRFVVSVSGLFDDDAVPVIVHRLQEVGCTKIEHYDVYPAAAKLNMVVNVRVETDVNERELTAAVKKIHNVNSVRAEEIDARPQ